MDKNNENVSYELRPIPDEIHDAFLNGHPKEHFMQTSVWGDIKAMGGRWHKEIVGLYKNGELAASTMLLHRKLPVFGAKLYYAPRGFIIDFDDWELVAAFTEKLREYLKAHHACYLIADPDIAFRRTDYKENLVEEHPDFVKKMEALGYRHGGFNMNFEGSQPRFTFRLALNDSKDAIFSRFSKIIRTGMKNSANYVECRKSDDVDLFYDIMNDTALRDHFIENPKEYYARVYNTLKERGMSKLYIATYLPKKHLAFLDEKEKSLRAEYAKLNEKFTAVPTDTKTHNKMIQIEGQLAKLAETRAVTEKADADYPDGVPLSSGITITTEHRAWLVFGGNRSIFREVGANYAIKYYEIFDDLADGFEFVDFFGAIGNPDPKNPLFGLHDFKRRFSGDYYEFPGEFHLVINPFVYNIWTKYSPKAIALYKKIYKMLRRK